MLIFENTIKSPATRKTYLYHLNKFMLFFDVKDYDGLAAITQKKLQIMMEDYVMHLKKTISPNAINLPIAAVKAFLDCNDVELRWSKIKRLKPARVKKTGGEAWLTSEVAKMLSFITELRTKTLVHFIASSGIRIGALEDIKMRHIKQIDDCKSILVYDGTNEEYVTFLTPEASLMFDDYIQKRESNGERLTPESPALRSSYQLGYAKVKPSNTNALKEIIRALILKSGLRINQIKIGKRYNKQADHGFRKRFNTILKTTSDMNISLVEKMMGHSVTVALDNVYLDPTVEQLFKEFKKAIPELTIDDSERIRTEKKNLEQKQTEVEKQRIENEKMLQRIEKLECGPEARDSTFYKNMFQVQGDKGAELLQTMVYFMFEMSVPEDEKREIWKKITQSRKNGQIFDLAGFLDDKKPSLKNWFSTSIAQS